AAVRRTDRPLHGQPCGARLERAGGRSIPRVGLAHPLRPEPGAGRRRSLRAPRHPRDAGLRAARGRAANPAGTGRRGVAAASARNRPDRAVQDGRTGALLYLHGVRVLVWLHIDRNFLLTAVLSASALSFVLI